MDELGNDMTKHRKKVVAAKTTNSKVLRAFVTTPDGDLCMLWHITVCLTTHADGKSLFLVDCSIGMCHLGGWGIGNFLSPLPQQIVAC